MGFKKFDEESSPEIYRGLSILYFFSLGEKINELDNSKSGIQQDLLYQLNKKDLISPKPKNYEELKTSFNNLFESTSIYLDNLK